MQPATTTPATPPPGVAPGQPYCGKCGYSLTGATETPRCPECGAPLVECLVRSPVRFPGVRSRRFTSPIQIFGLPLVQIAFGPDPDSGAMRGKAKAFIALGDHALGVIAIGGMPVGVVALGGMSVGLFSMGGMSIGLVTAAGGMAAGLGLSAGGGAIGALSIGGMSAGYGAVGGLAIGRFAVGGQAFGPHAFSAGASVAGDPAAARFFRDSSWFFGSSLAPPGRGLVSGWQAAASITGANIAVTAALLLIALIAKHTHRKPDPFTMQT